MHSDFITIEPQVIQFNHESTQTIKITNKTNKTLSNFFFCLYNLQKFQFKPQSFDLAPNQNKLIQVTLKIKSTKSITKQFAYLKSTDISQRLTLLINNFQSPDYRTKQTEEGYSDMNTLSSRDYHELHNRALNKIITEQQRNMVEGVREFNKTENFTIGSSSKKDFENLQYLKEMETKNIELESRNMELEKQVEELNDILAKKDFQMEKLEHDNKFLFDQDAKLLRKITDKQTRIKELQTLYDRLVTQNKLFSDKNIESSAKVQLLQRQLQLQKQQSSMIQEQQVKKNKIRQSEMKALYESYEERIKELQNIVESSQKQQTNTLNRELKQAIEQKQIQLQAIRKQLQQNQILLKQQQNSFLKFEKENARLVQINKGLQQENQQIAQLNNNLREQIYVFKTKVDDPSNTKLQQYLQIALQSYKSENQTLKRSKQQLEKSLDSIVKPHRQSQTQKQLMTSKIQSLSEQLHRIELQLQKQHQFQEQLRLQHQLKVKQITERNVELLEQIAAESQTKREQQTSRLKEETERLQEESSRLREEIKEKCSQVNQLTSEVNALRKSVQSLENQLQSSRMNQSSERLAHLEELKNQLSKENEKLLEEKEKLEQKVRKYKTQTKKELKSINETAVDELKRHKQEKKELQKKVAKLQKTILKLENNQSQMSENQRNSMTDKNSSSSHEEFCRGHINNQEDQCQRCVSCHCNMQSDNYARSKSHYQTVGTHPNNTNGIMNRKIGIHNQRHQLYEGKSHESQSLSTKNPLLTPQMSHSNIQYELYELRELNVFLHNQQQRFEYMFNLQSELSDPVDQNGRPLSNIKPLYKAIKFFKIIQNKIKSLNQKAQQSIILNKENTFIRQKLTQLQRKQQETKKQEVDRKQKDLSCLSVNYNNHTNLKNGNEASFFANRTNLTNMNVFQMIEFLKGEMKKQYNKQSENIKFLEEKYNILKKKIYREYRSRIIELINQGKRDLKPSNVVGRIQSMIQRYIEGLSNLTHKEAVLSKQVKIKNSYKQEVLKLKQKNTQLEHLLSQKHSATCNRDPVKVFNCSTTNLCTKEQDWMESIKLSAQLLTQKAQTQRLQEQLNIVRQDYNALKEQLSLLAQKNDSKDSEIIKLKMNQIQLQNQYKQQLVKQEQILAETQNKLTSKTKPKSSRVQEKLNEKERQLDVLRSQLDKKNVLIRSYKEKEKKWEEYVNETGRADEKEKLLANSYKRIEENNAMINETNRELRQENSELKAIIDKLQKELEKKKLYIKTLKAEDEQSHITKPLRIQQSIQQIQSLQQALKNAKEELSKIKKQKEKQIVRLESEMTSAKNQYLIHIKSLQSVIRATIETIRKIFGSFKILIKRKGLTANMKRTQINIPENLIQINATEIYEQFQEIVQTLEN